MYGFLTKPYHPWEPDTVHDNIVMR
jgi:hypothetical protein